MGSFESASLLSCSMGSAIATRMGVNCFAIRCLTKAWTSIELSAGDGVESVRQCDNLHFGADDSDPIKKIHLAMCATWHLAEL